MRSFFVLSGAGWLAARAPYARGAPRSGAALGAGSLWYLVAGTASSVLRLALLALERRGDAGGGD